MNLLGFLLIPIGVGIIIGNYHDKEHFMSRDYTEKDIRTYQKILAIGCGIVLIGLIMMFS